MKNLNITIEDYLTQTKYICEGLIELISKIAADKMQIDSIKAVIPLYEKKAEMLAQGAIEKRKTDKAQSLKEMAEAAGYGIAARKSHERVNKVDGTYNNALFITNGPLESVSQALLQIAKQGISSTYKVNSKKRCMTAFDDTGKVMPQRYNVSILDIIWEGRNQSIHYEDGKKLHDNVKLCFDSLLRNGSYDVCTSLIGYDNGENKAYEIIKVLGWTDYKQFYNDMMSLSL